MNLIHDENLLKDTKEQKKEYYGNINLIKSIYIVKRILSHLEIEKKFEFIKYNKKFSESLGYTLDDYKNLCKRYIIYKKNGTVEEYKMNSKILIFEGKYENKKRNGKGKEYYENGKLKFKGEYINNKRNNGILYDNMGNIILNIEKNGKGKENYSNGKYQFIGQYLNGKRWNGKGHNYEGKKEFEFKSGNGKGKEYDFYGYILFEGEYKNRKRDGKGIEYAYNKIIFEGEYKNGERNGMGKSYNGKDYLLSEEIYSYGKICYLKEYYNNGILKFEGQCLKGEKWNGIN